MNDRKEQGVKGNVKFFSEKYYSIGKSGGQVLYNTKFFRFDSAGHLLEKAEYEGVGQTVSVTYASSDSAEIKHSSYITNGGLNNKTVYTYDKRGNKTEVREYKSDTTKYERTGYYYNSKHQLIEVMTFDIYGHWTWLYDYKYDSKGVRIGEQQRDQHNVLREDTKLTYDEKGKLIVSDTKGNSAIESGKLVWKYDDKNNQIEEDLYNANGSTYYIKTFKYDERNNQLEEQVIEGDGSFSYKIAYKYDENNNKIWSNRYKTKDSIGSFTYTYTYENIDKAGNWLKKTTYENGMPDIMEERTIEYY